MWIETDNLIVANIWHVTESPVASAQGHDC